MGLFRGFDTACFKRKYRWMFSIQDVAGDPANLSSNALPPSKGSRPSLNFKELEAQHLSETIFYPGKPDWKPITVTLYDIRSYNNPVFNWIARYYNPETGSLQPSSAFLNTNGNTLKVPSARLQMYSGCGKVIEEWIFENVWPQAIEFGELDMSQGDVVTIDLTLRYDRAYINLNPDDLYILPEDEISQSGSQIPSPENFSPPPFSNNDLGNIPPISIPPIRF